MLPPVPLTFAEVSDGTVALVIFAVVIVGVIVAIAMGKGK